MEVNQRAGDTGQCPGKLPVHIFGNPRDVQMIGEDRQVHLRLGIGHAQTFEHFQRRQTQPALPREVSAEIGLDGVDVKYDPGVGHMPVDRLMDGGFGRRLASRWGLHHLTLPIHQNEISGGQPILGAAAGGDPEGIGIAACRQVASGAQHPAPRIKIAGRRSEMGARIILHGQAPATSRVARGRRSRPRNHRKAGNLSPRRADIRRDGPAHRPEDTAGRPADR